MFVRTYLEGYLIHPKKTYKIQPLKIDEKCHKVHFYLVLGFNHPNGEPYYQKEYTLYGGFLYGRVKSWLDEDAIIEIEYPETIKEMLLEAIEKHQFLSFVLDENYTIMKIWKEGLYCF